MDNKNDKAKGLASLSFVGCLFIGLGVGLVFKQPAAGILIGMGVGFISMGIIKFRFGIW